MGMGIGIRQVSNRIFRESHGCIDRDRRRYSYGFLFQAS